MQGSPSFARDRAVQSVRTSLVQDAAFAVVENLEGRTLMASDPLAYLNTVVSLPYVLEFDRTVPGLHDKVGQEFGLTRVQVNKNGLSSSYLPALIDLRTDLGVLNITTSGTSRAGSNYRADNTMTNAVETMFDATTSGFQITTRLKGPLGFIDKASEQAGIFFGPDQDNYIKLVAIARDEGMRLQFLDEQTYSGVYTHSLNSIRDVGDLKNVQTLDLRLEGDAGNGRVRAYYSINGASFVKMPTELTLSGKKRAAFFSPMAKAGLITVHKNDTGPMTVSYDRFEIQPGRALAGRPSVVATRPGDGATDVRRDAFIAADLNLPNAGIDTESLKGNTVKLYRTSDRSIVPAVVNTSGGGDTIVLQPTLLLDANTHYTFEVTDGVKDEAGGAFVSYAMTFTTGSAGAETDASLSFEKVNLPSTYGEAYTSVKVGPDNKLYASTETGKIIRWNINNDGTLGSGQVITSLQDHNVGPRLIIGFDFDPGAPASSPVLWVTHGVADIQNAPDWSSKVTKMSGSNLGTVQDVVKNLPRATRDHISNQPSFGPDGKLYFPQGSNSAMGAPDVPWGMRPERLLSAAILCLDPTKIPAGTVLDAQTEEGGSYNPYAPGAPLTIYATGIRNAYDLVWTSDGRLFTATNGSASGGATPAGGGAPGIAKVGTTQNDYLYLIEKGGYYGHPNPTRNEFVMNGGNPTAELDPAEVIEYPVGVQPDSNWRGSVYDFGKNYSPNGILEYKNATAFNGALKGKLLIVRFSGGDDIIVLTKDTAGKVTQSQTGIAGMRNFVDPLDVAENTANGYLYVAEYSESDPTQRKITLLRPIPPGAKATANKSQMVFNDIAGSFTGGSGSSKAQTVRITNTGTVPLSFPSDGFQIVDDPASAGNDATLFRITNLGSLPDTIGVGEWVDVNVAFTANAVGVESASLRIKSNDASRPSFDIALRGVGTSGTGGANEPSLARILRAYNIPTIVGDGANDAEDDTTTYPVPAHSSSEEVAMPRLQKAGPGTVSIEVIASMAKADSTGAIAGRLGYYTPGNRADKTELFSILGADAQTLDAQLVGNTRFDPGEASFSLYGVFPGFADATKDKGMPREVFSEASLNTWDANAANRHKIRFFPLRESDGSIVPNAFIFAIEEYDTANDFNDVVGIIRNVKAAPAGPEIGLENMDGVPFTDRLVFSRIQDPFPGPKVDSSTGLMYQPPPNKVHDTVVMLVRNTGTDPLVINSIGVTADYELVNAPAAGTSIQPGGSLSVTVKFIATSGGGIKNGTLTIVSNDADETVTTVQLAGWWQPESENNKEPGLQRIVSTFGYGTNITHAGELLSPPGEGGKIRRVGDEVLSPYWRRTDSSTPVTVRQLAAFHRQGKTADIYWHQQNSTTVSKIFTHSGNYGQSLLPLNEAETGPAAGKFRPSGAFGWRVDGREWSDPTKNPIPEGQPQDEGHHMRFWVARDRAGKIIPNTYIMAMDYAGINYDYQDNVYLITNIKPTSPPSQPVGLTASTSGGKISLDWLDNTEANLGGYNVYRSNAADGTYAKVNPHLLIESTFTDIFAPIGQVSHYRIVAVDNAGNESAPATLSATRTGDSIPPTQPQGLTAVGSVNGVTLDWADNGEPDLAGYEVYRSASQSGPFARLGPGMITSSNYVDLSAPQGAVSYYHVIAIDNSGNKSAPAAGNAMRTGNEPAPTVPAAPAGLTATAAGSSTVALSWTASAGATSYRIERRTTGGAWGEIAAAVTSTSYPDAGRSPATTYDYRLRAENSAGLSAYGSVASATTAPTQTPPPATGQYTGMDIGGIARGNTVTITDGVAYDVTGGGPNVAATEDGFHFAYKQLSGDFDIKVKVESLTNTDPIARAGLMARETLNADSRNAFSFVTADSGFRFSRRTSTGGDTTWTKTGTVNYAIGAWVRLRRIGDTYIGYYSTNGTSWTQTGSVSINMGSTVYVGMGVSSRTTSALATAKFRQLTTATAASTAQPPAAPAGLTAQAMTSNTINLAWQASSGATSYRVERRVAGGVFSQIALGVAGNGYVDNGRLSDTTYEYRVRAENSAGLSEFSNIALVKTPISGVYASADINSTPGGSTTVITAGSAYDITAGGSNIYGTIDGFRFASRQVTGDFDIKVQLQSFTGPTATGKAGLMARATTAANSPNVFSYATVGSSYRFQHRATAGGSTTMFKSGTPAYPNVWLRLTRVGNTFTGYYSATGVTWTKTSSTTLALPATVHLGMAVSAESTTQTARAQFRNLGST